jgi:NTE family protein
MKRALVLSGGGARGAFELGALEYIREKQPSYYDFQIIAGVSVGSLNGVMLAQNKFEALQKLWSDIANEKVYSGKLPTGLWEYLGLIIKTLFGRRSILGIEPLIKQINEVVNLADVKTDYRCGFVSLVSGEYVPCKHTEFGNDNDNFRKAILASSTMPLIWEPVGEIKIGNQSYTELVDGGVRNISPLKDVIVDQPTEIIIINCSTSEIHPSPNAGQNIFKIAQRSLTDITLNEIFRGDIEEFVKTNDIVKQCDGKVTLYRDKEKGEVYKYFKSIIIEPLVGLGDSLDFSSEQIKKSRKAGYDAAQAAFSKPEKDLPMTTVRSYKETKE